MGAKVTEKRHERLAFIHSALADGMTEYKIKAALGVSDSVFASLLHDYRNFGLGKPRRVWGWLGTLSWACDIGEREAAREMHVAMARARGDMGEPVELEASPGAVPPRPDTGGQHGTTGA